MDLRQLEMLLAVVESGGYLKAGDLLHVSHSAIHRQVRLLEQEVGDRLLVRVGRHMELTEAGRILTTLARTVRREISDTLRRIADLNELQSGHLRIGTGTAMLVRFLTRVMQQFRREYPQIEMHTLTGTAEHILRELQSGNLDLGIVFAHEDPLRNSRLFEQEVLYREEFVWVCGKRHALAGKRTATLAQLVRYPFIVYTKTSTVRRLFDRCFETAGLEPKILMEVENEEAIQEMVQLNMGISLLTRRRAVKEHLDFVSVPGQPIVCPVGMVLPRQDYVPRAVREFAAICRRAARELQPS